MEYNYYFSLASSIFLLFIVFCLVFKVFEKSVQNKRFIRLTYTLLAACLFDVFAVVGYEHITPENSWFVMVLYGLNFFSMAVTVYIYDLYVESYIDNVYAKSKKRKVINLILFYAYLVTHILNLFIKIFYYFDEECVYYHAIAYYMLYFVPIYYIIDSMIMLISFRKKLSPRQMFSMMTFSLLIVVASVVQFWMFPMILISLFAGACGLTIIFFFLETPDYKILLDAMEDLKKAEEIAQEERIKAYAANQAKSSFLANVSHEIRTPINAVLGMNEMIIRETSEESIREYALDVNSAGKSLLAIINDILDISKIEAGKMETNCAEYEVQGLFESITSMIQLRAKKKNLRFIVEIDKEIPCRLFGDDIRIKQIIMNLLSNGVKYTNEGSVKLCVSVVEKDLDSEVTLHIEVTDTGIGIKPEDMESLFQAFKRLDEKTNRMVEGTGLGMSIANELLHLMDSQLYVESEYGKGSKFYFDLRQRVIDSSPIGDFNSSESSQEKLLVNTNAFSAIDSKILVVDDNSINRKVVVGFLKPCGCKVYQASSGFECLEMVKKEHFDLILMDHLMPELDGVGTLEKLKSEENLCNDTPVVACTANAISGMKESFLATGFDDFISKPINSSQLQKIVKDLLPKEQVKDGCEIVEAVSEEVLPDLENFDMRYAKLCLGSAGVVKSVASDFYDQTFRIESALESYLKELDDDEKLERYRIDVHTLKSTSRMLGEIALSGLAKTSEYAAKDKDRTKIRMLHPLIISELAVARTELLVLLPQKLDEVEHKDEITNSRLLELLHELDAALNERDVKKQDELAKILEQSTCEERFSNQIDEVVENIKILKMLKALQIVTELIQELEES